MTTVTNFRSIFFETFGASSSAVSRPAAAVFKDEEGKWVVCRRPIMTATLSSRLPLGQVTEDSVSLQPQETWKVYLLPGWSHCSFEITTSEGHVTGLSGGNDHLQLLEQTGGLTWSVQMADSDPSAAAVTDSLSVTIINPTHGNLLINSYIHIVHGFEEAKNINLKIVTARRISVPIQDF